MQYSFSVPEIFDTNISYFFLLFGCVNDETLNYMAMNVNFKTQIFHRMKYDRRGFMRQLLCYEEVARFLKTFQSFDKITTLTSFLMDNFYPCFLFFWIALPHYCFSERQ